MNPRDEIRALLQSFQDGYIHRDLSQLDPFMKLFTLDAEVIGTNGIKPGIDEWFIDRGSARELVEGDWLDWGDLRLDLESMSIHYQANVGWVAAAATVTKIIGTENYDSYLEFVRKFLDNSKLPAEQKLHYIIYCAVGRIPSMNCTVVKSLSGHYASQLSLYTKRRGGSLPR